VDQLGKWFNDIFESVNKGGRLAPPVASRKRVSALLEQLGGEGVLKLSSLLGIGDAEAVRQLAGCRPDLGEYLGSEGCQSVLDRYFEERAEVFEPYRRLVARALSAARGSTELKFDSSPDAVEASAEAWGKVFRLLTGGEKDGKESSGL
jgi:hypothetical protein